MNAQPVKDGTDKRKTNSEPSHSQFILEEERTMPITLLQNELNKSTYSHSVQYVSQWQDKEVFIRIDELEVPYQFLINSFAYGNGMGNFAPVEFNITPFLNHDANLIQLKVDTPDDSQGNRSETALVLIREPVLVRDILVTTYHQNISNQTLVRVHLFVQSFLTEKNKGRTLTMTILDPRGEILESSKKLIDFPLSYRQEVEFTFDQPLENPFLWSIHHPALYTARVSLVDEERNLAEKVWTTFGVRNAHVEDSLLIINQDTLIPKVLDYESQIKPVAQSDKELLNLLEMQGFNAVKSHQPIPSRLMEIFDRQGIVVFKKKDELDPSLDLRDVNRPSVVWIDKSLHFDK